jgi:hypothetical protein
MKTMRACTFIQFGEEAIHIPKCCGRTEEQAKSYYKNRDMKYKKPLLLLLCHFTLFPAAATSVCQINCCRYIRGPRSAQEKAGKSQIRNKRVGKEGGCG